MKAALINLSLLPRIAYYSGIYIVAAVLLISGISKILDPMPLIETLKAFIKLPEDITILIATILPVLEIGLALLLMLEIKPKPVLYGTLILFTLFLAFSVYGTIKGMNNDCGCFGSLVKSQIGWGMIGRNAILFVLVILEYKIMFKKPSAEVTY